MLPAQREPRLLVVYSFVPHVIPIRHLEVHGTPLIGHSAQRLSNYLIQNAKNKSPAGVRVPGIMLLTVTDRPRSACQSREQLPRPGYCRRSPRHHRYDRAGATAPQSPDSRGEWQIPPCRRAFGGGANHRSSIQVVGLTGLVAVVI
jgi:hypothetical protein